MCNLYMCTSVATKYDILAQLSFHQFPLYEKCIAFEFTVPMNVTSEYTNLLL